MNQTFKQQRNFKILAYPLGKSPELKSLFLDFENSIKNKLERPQIIRPMGWSLETRDRAVVGESGDYIVVKEDRKRIELYRKGILFLECLADKSFLGWNSEEGLRIHSLALIELIYNFIRFYYEDVINDFKTKPKTFCVRFSFENLHLGEKKTYIVPGGFNALEFNKYEARRNNFISRPLCFDINNYKIGEITYEIIKEIYSTVFGIFIDSTTIPYVKVEDGKYFIDEEEIKNIK